VYYVRGRTYELEPGDWGGGIAKMTLKRYLSSTEVHEHDGV